MRRFRSTALGAALLAVALIGKGGLGALMLGGFRNLFPDIAMVVGVGLSVLLAVLVDGVLLGVQRLSTPWAGTARVTAT